MSLTARSVALALIRRFEGCRLVAYQDGAGVWTIGRRCAVEAFLYTLGEEA